MHTEMEVILWEIMTAFVIQVQSLWEDLNSYFPNQIVES